MAAIRDLTTADIASLRIRAVAFQDEPLWAALRDLIAKDRTRIVRDLEDANTPAERLKYAQGELAQANRDIMLVERFLLALEKEQERQRLKEERS